MTDQRGFYVGIEVWVSVTDEAALRAAALREDGAGNAYQRTPLAAASEVLRDRLIATYAENAAIGIEVGSITTFGGENSIIPGLPPGSEAPAEEAPPS